jgi:hypothetical protein
MDFESIIKCSVEVIVIHRHAHNDELFAVYLLKAFGGVQYFPGIQEARLEFWDSIPEGKNWKDLLFNEKTLLVGMGFSPFDEHLQSGERMKNECAATLVATALGIREDEYLKPFFWFTLDHDRAVGKNAFELPALIKAMWAVGKSEDEVVAVANCIYETICNQAEGFAKASADFKKASIRKLRTAQGQIVVMVYGFSDSPEFGKYARSKGMGIVIWMNSSGNVTIHTQHILKLDLGPVVRAIRILELTAAHEKVPTDNNYLASGGAIAECLNWYFHTGGGMIMNGSMTHAALPTRVSLEEIANAVILKLHKELKPQQHSRGGYGKHNKPQPQNPSQQQTIAVGA